MAVIGGLLMVVGGIIMFVGGIMFLITAFKESVLWGLGTMFVPFVGLIFLITHWQDAKKPFLIQLMGLPFYILGLICMAAGAGG